MRRAALTLLTACGAASGAQAPASPPLANHEPVAATATGHTLTGTLTFRAGAKPGTAVFLIVKRRGSDGRAAVGVPLAAARLRYDGKDLPFSLDDRDALIAGVPLAGDVVVIARYDQDDDALSKQDGDLIGEAQATVPAAGVRIVVDRQFRAP